MNSNNIETDSLLLDFESFSETGIELSSFQVDQAIELSDRLENPERQWRTYLNSLALFGFENWLESRSDSLVIEAEQCSVRQPSQANYIDGVFNLRVGKYKICLLTNGVAIDELVTIDRALIDLPEYAAHFYLLLDVVEEQAEVKLNSFIRYEEIRQRQQKASLVPTEDWTYELPLAWFEHQPEDLLLYLRCIEPELLQLPAMASSNEEILTQLEPLLPQLRSSQSLDQILTWSQAAPILRNPKLLGWLYRLQSDQLTVADGLTSLRNSLTQTAINVKSWLSNELDELAQNLSWTLLPPPVFAANGLRDLSVVNRASPTEEFAAIVTQLRRSGEGVPPEARGACQDFTLGNHQLRLFALTWEIEEENVPEWSLLLVLGGQPDHYLPQDLRLEVRESEIILDTKAIDRDTSDSYLYTQVIGELNEQFTVRVILRDGTAFTFPDFIFN
ncbi:MAG: DUF1822 family protein [Cyanobacteria bacterium J06600_6]